MLVKSESAKEKIVGPMRIREYKINSSFSGALIEIDGRHGKIKCLKEDRIYFILSGTGFFCVANKEEKVSKNDLVFVPKNTPYNIKGKLKYFIICSPEFKPEDDVVIK